MEIVLVALGLAMDAFAASICIGLTLDRVTSRRLFRVAFHFGFFQFLMPIIGWYSGNEFGGFVEKFDHWIAFGLLSLVGTKMILGVFEKKDSRENVCKDRTRGLPLVVMSLATSIDALAVGAAYAFLNRPIIEVAIFTGIITSTLSFLGMKGGQKIGEKFGKIMGLFGGIILLSLGAKILIEHLG